MSANLMNDTFDNFTFSNIENLTNFISPQSQSNKTENSPQVKTEISFDDSLFFTSLDYTGISNGKHEEMDNSKNTSEKSKQVNSLTQSEQSTLNNTDNNLDLFSSFNSDLLQDSQKEEDCFSSTLNQSKKVSVSKEKSIQLDENIHNLSNWGLPESVLEKYALKKITTMFPWQVECLNNSKLMENHANLVYSAPTSAGKTLVSEILTMKTIFEREKKVVFILPFVSVVREKMFYFQDILSSSGVRVEGFMGSYNPPGGFQSVQLAVCTIEKANSLINKLLQEGNLSQVGAVIIDELHLLGDPSRGYLLELLLTKLKYISLNDENVNIQIIGMSATLPNLDFLAKWLNAELYVTDFRPIPLYEQAYMGGAIYNNTLQLTRSLQPIPELDTDTDNILQLCLETICENSCSVLIFCPTKNWCENLAQQIAMAFWKLGCCQNSELSLQLRHQLKPDLITEVLEQLKFSPVGVDAVLKKTIAFGVAFHHAGLTMDERDIIEGAFRNGTVRVLIATSTLSSGVNLPARRVIVRTPIFHGKPLDTLTYRQMIGRAGRMGKDTAGESILVCQKKDYHLAQMLMSAELEAIESCLEGAGKLKRAILEVVASGVASTPQDIELFTQCTLLAQNDNFENPIGEALRFLVSNEFIRLHEMGDGVLKYAASSLGKACLSSSIPPEDGLALFTELEKARQCFVLETELHLIYLVTPYSACYQWGNIDWLLYLNFWEKLPPSMKKVGELVGVKESYIISATRATVQSHNHKLLIHKRFFIALALQDLVDEKPLSEVCAKFNCNRGMLQSLQLTASTFAGMVTAFSKQLGWSSVEILISQFQDRLHFGVSRDLLDLMRLPILNGKCARALYNGGVETLVHLANSDVTTIEEILHRVMPFESNKARDGESEYDLRERNKLRNIWITGKEGLTEKEAADLLLKSARNYLQIELGLKEAKWDNKTDEKETIVNDLSRLYISNSVFATDESLFEDNTPDGTSKSVKDAFISNYCVANSSNISLNSSGGDFINTSQDESCLSLAERTIRSSRKRLRKRDKENDLLIMNQESPRKKKKFIKKTGNNTFLMDDGVDLSGMEIIDVCSTEDLINNFRNEIQQAKCISLAVACGRIQENKPLIGVCQKSKQLTENFAFKKRKVHGFAISFGKDTAYYLDLEKRQTIDLVKSVVQNPDLIVRMFDGKKHVKVLQQCCNIEFSARMEDPKIADWLLDPEAKQKSLPAMIQAYYPKGKDLVDSCTTMKGVGSIALNLHSGDGPKLRSSVEAVATWHLVQSIKGDLQRQNSKLLHTFADEMACSRILAQMELVGFGCSKTNFSGIIVLLKNELNLLEKKAFALAGRRFSFTSSKEVGKILGIEKIRNKLSTKKQILEKHHNPIADLILQWRKINTIVVKMIQPLVRAIDNNRIYGSYIVHTATGRISMHEPNIQSVAKDFTLPNGQTISCRNAFVAREDCVLISADYCQLELRLLTHFSQDAKLCGIMKEPGDVLKSIAAKWNRIEESQVDDDMRQHTKQICYGIIYGMGSRALAEQLGIDEKEAGVFMETFRNAYPGVKCFIKKVIEDCKEREFVETLAKRRRYLPLINSEDSALQKQAERQAVNTTIQGSAADVVKNTMIKLEEKCKGLKYQARLVLHLHDELLYEVPVSYEKHFASFLKSTMEESVKLSIPFPVKVKTGSSWGQLTEYHM